MMRRSEGGGDVVKSTGQSRFGVLNLLALIEDAADSAGLQEQPDYSGIGGDDFVVGNV